MVPDALRILSEADNSKHDNYQTESPIHTMFNIHRRAIRQEAASASDYATICKQVSRGRKPASLQLDALTITSGLKRVAKKNTDGTRRVREEFGCRA